MAPAPSPALSPFSDFTSSRCHRASDQRQLRYSDAKAPPPPSPPPCPRGKVHRRLPEHHELSASQRLCSPSWSSIQHPPLTVEIPGCSHEKNLGPSTTRTGPGHRQPEEAKHAVQQHSRSWFETDVRSWAGQLFTHPVKTLIKRPSPLRLQISEVAYTKYTENDIFRGK